jgi:hypothetical protein
MNEKLFWGQVQANVNHGQRKGQAMVNALLEIDPELYDLIASEYPSAASAFYDDSQVFVLRDLLKI